MPVSFEIDHSPRSCHYPSRLQLVSFCEAARLLRPLMATDVNSPLCLWWSELLALNAARRGEFPLRIIFRICWGEEAQ
jgi:hypothetical protein